MTFFASAGLVALLLFLPSVIAIPVPIPQPIPVATIGNQVEIKQRAAWSAAADQGADLGGALNGWKGQNAVDETPKLRRRYYGRGSYGVQGAKVEDDGPESLYPSGSGRR